MVVSPSAPCLLSADNKMCVGWLMLVLIATVLLFKGRSQEKSTGLLYYNYSMMIIHPLPIRICSAIARGACSPMTATINTLAAGFCGWAVFGSCLSKFWLTIFGFDRVKFG
uniref:Uncharacterized protein n=1 Tax=Ditylenchus dipsaci TaxID=166011 RepID=A0A915ER66_9BILA